MDGWLAETIALIKGRLHGLDIIQLLRSPYFIIASTVFCGFALLKRMWEVLFLFVIAIGLALLFHYTMPEQQSWRLESESLILFAGGGILICGAVIYFFFIRSE